MALDPVVARGRIQDVDLSRDTEREEYGGEKRPKQDHGGIRHRSVWSI